jgi:hypothetical protein
MDERDSYSDFSLEVADIERLRAALADSRRLSRAQHQAVMSSSMEALKQSRLNLLVCKSRYFWARTVAMDAE